jgi:tricorn protease
MNQFARDYYHQFNKDALIVDVRHNGGGNIDSWLLAKLMRKPWMWWQPRVGEPYHNMQYAFNGPMATIVNEWSGSDGEIFPEGFRRLGLGKSYGVRTWGGEIWLTSSTVLADRGLATEQHGVEPDMVVDNLPAGTFAGSDAQLAATVQALLDEVAKRPMRGGAPGYPKKSD